MDTGLWLECAGVEAWRGLSVGRCMIRQQMVLMREMQNGKVELLWLCQPLS